MTPWTHRRLRQRVSAFVDGELDGAASAEVERHLGRCWGCSGAAEQLRMIKASLAHLRRARPESLATARLRRWAASMVHASGPPAV